MERNRHQPLLGVYQSQFSLSVPFLRRSLFEVPVPHLIVRPISAFADFAAAAFWDLGFIAVIDSGVFLSRRPPLHRPGPVRTLFPQVTAVLKAMPFYRAKILTHADRVKPNRANRPIHGTPTRVHVSLAHPAPFFAGRCP